MFSQIVCQRHWVKIKFASEKSELIWADRMPALLSLQGGADDAAFAVAIFSAERFDHATEISETMFPERSGNFVLRGRTDERVHLNRLAREHRFFEMAVNCAALETANFCDFRNSFALLKKMQRLAHCVGHP